MEQGDIMIVQSPSGINTMELLAVLSYCIKVKWGNGIEEWLYKADFKPANAYVMAKIKVLQVIK